eukprot:gene19051-22807_t
MLLGLFMVFAPVIGYVSQYKSIATTRSSEGFSTRVCLILLLANILRVYFWIGKQFDDTLLYQSLVMIVAQLTMLHLCVSVKASDSILTRQRRDIYQYMTSAFSPSDFWDWDVFPPYLVFLGAYSVFFLMLTYMFIYVPSFFELLGALSLTIEAMLGVPQLIQNYQKRSTKGLSFVLIGSWFIGDLFKTSYFYFTGAPNQFVFCGTFQLLVDGLITYQMLTY